MSLFSGSIDSFNVSNWFLILFLDLGENREYPSMWNRLIKAPTNSRLTQTYSHSIKSAIEVKLP